MFPDAVSMVTWHVAKLGYIVCGRTLAKCIFWLSGSHKKLLITWWLFLGSQETMLALEVLQRWALQISNLGGPPNCYEFCLQK